MLRINPHYVSDFWMWALRKLFQMCGLGKGDKINKQNDIRVPLLCGASVMVSTENIETGGLWWKWVTEMILVKTGDWKENVCPVVWKHCPPLPLPLPKDNGFDCTVWLEWKDGVTVSASPWGECIISRHEFKFICHLTEKAFIVGQFCMKPLTVGSLVRSHNHVAFHVAYSEE